MKTVVIGTTFMDVKGYPDCQYVPAGRNAGSIKHVHGGVARNIAEDIANLELRPILVSLVDDDALGHEITEKLEKHKVNTEYLRYSENGLGTWLAIFDHTGDVVASISKRPDLQPLVGVLQENEEAIFADADSILLELDIEESVVKQVFSAARKYEIPIYAVISNIRMAMERRDFFTQIECFVCNLQEAEFMFMEDFQNITPEEMAKILAVRIHNAGIHSMVVTMGGKGAAYVDNQGRYGTSQPKKVEVIDTTGAGDAFFAGVATGLTAGKSMQEACEIGTKLAASVICRTENVCPRFRPEEFGL